MTPVIAISIVLATRNRAPSLARLLDGLANQVDAPSFEVIVADNGSSDETPKVVEQAGKKLNVRYLREERPGKGRALNAALWEAQGELIVFTDDDVQPFPDWLFQMHKAAQEYPEYIAFGGRIVVDIERVPRWIRDSYTLMGPLTSAHDNGPAPVPYAYGAYPYGPNMAIRRNTLKKVVNPFAETIGPGTPQSVGDESFFWKHFSPASARDRLYVPLAAVFHEVESNNMAFFHAVRRCFLLGRCHAWLGLPAAAQEPNVNNCLAVLIKERIKKCRSLREFLCVSVRFMGFQWGKIELNKGKIPASISG